MRRFFVLFVFASVFLPSIAFSQVSEPASGFSFDVETDPLAFALNGHSLHIGVGWSRFRFDFGNFGLEIPEFVHGNKGFTSRFDGFGTKFDVFYSEDQNGFFAGASGAFVRSHIGLSDGSHRIVGIQGTIEGRVGYRIKLPHNFFVSPWVSVGTVIGGGDVAIGDQIYESTKLSIFPTIHIGYRIK